jgi:hypothetical protein
MRKGTPDGIKSFSEFWPFYVREHLNPVSRTLHVVGTLLGVVLAVDLIRHELWSYLWAPIVVGYGSAWIGHFVFEKNRPATFKYPLWSFFGDWKMIFKVLTRGMRAEVERAVKDGRSR